MKKDKSISPTSVDDLLPEYELDFSKAKPNKYAEILKSQDRLVQLEPDVYKVYDTPEKVNSALRFLIKNSVNTNIGA